jgi:hypothetical protein
MTTLIISEVGDNMSVSAPKKSLKNGTIVFSVEGIYHSTVVSSNPRNMVYVVRMA